MQLSLRKLAKINFVLILLTYSSPAMAQFIKADNVDVNPIYYGQAGFKTLPGSIKLETKSEVKEVFLKRQVTWARTGKSSSDLELTGTWGAIRLPAGSRFYAMPFKDGFLSQQKKLEERGIKIPNVAWCTPDYKPEKGDPLCFFADQTRKENYGTSGAGSVFYPEYMGISQYNNIFKSPDIQETHVEFDIPLTLEVQIKKIKKKTIKLEVQLFDGTKRSDIVSEKVERAEDGSARFELWGGSFDIRPTGKKTFEVNQVTPFKSSISLEDEKLILPYSLRS